MLSLESVLSFIKRFFKPETSPGIKRLQYFWISCLGVALLGVSYAGVRVFFDQSNQGRMDEKPKLPPKVIEDSSSKVATRNEEWRYKMENDNKKLSEEITALKTLFQEGMKDKESANQTYIQDLETKILQMEMQLEDKKKSPEPTDLDPQLSYQAQEGADQEGKIIQKFTLGLIENSASLKAKTVETTIPAGAFAKTVLLSGLDASASMNASSDPRPMLLRLIESGTLPRQFQSDLKDCHLTASAYGDLSSERVYARLEKLSCIERATGEIIETQVAGYIAGADGKAGIRGIVASKDGKFLSRSLMGGIFAGLSNVANPQVRQSQVNPFFPGSPQVSPPSIGETFASGMSSGASSALDRLSQYYIDRAEQLQPVIQIAAGQIVDIVFTEGTFIGSQNIKTEIEKTREEARQSSIQSSMPSIQKGE